MGFFSNRGKPLELPSKDEALPGRLERVAVPSHHYVLETPLLPPYPEQCEQVAFAMGCFWGAERLFWQLPGVYTTAAGYTGGHTPNPTYEEVCSGFTAHAEAVLVVFDPVEISFQQLLTLFWEKHDPTQGMRQGNDIGTQYRSAIYTSTELQRAEAEASLERYQSVLDESITTTVEPLGEFYFAEHGHQQYLAKDPNGYCGLRGTGVAYPS